MKPGPIESLISKAIRPLFENSKERLPYLEFFALSYLFLWPE